MATNVVPYASIAFAAHRANERRKWLSTALREAELPAWVIAETPPGERIADIGLKDDSLAERHGQLARLYWQLGSNAFLLLERTTDVVLEVLAYKVSGPLAIKLELLPRRIFRPGLFRWRVIVCSFDKEVIRERLKTVGDWLGIGVDIEEPVEIKPLSKCKAGYGGREGLVGGVINSPRSAFALTCEHVVFAGCNSLAPGFFLGGSPAAGFTSVPDVALLNVRNPCFEVPDESADSVTPATASWTEYCILNRTPVVQTHPRSQGKSNGAIKAAVSVTAIAGKVYRFPQLEIIARVSSYLFGLLKLPLNRRFSYPGDSGAWVREMGAGGWVGMVTAGDDQGSTYATDASALVNYLMAAGHFQQSAFATTWTRDTGRQ